MSNNNPYKELVLIVEEWAVDHPDLVRLPFIFATTVAGYAFEELLQLGPQTLEGTEDD